MPPNTLNVNRSIKNSFTLGKARSNRYPVEAITADYIDHLALFENIPTQAKFLMHSLQQAAGSVGFYVNANKTERIRFKLEGVNNTLSDSLLKLVDKFTYLSRNISSTGNDVSNPLEKVVTAIERLSII